MTIGHAAMSTVVQSAAAISLVWSTFVYIVQIIGIYQIFRHHSNPHPKPVSPTLQHDEIPHITVIRPVKGVDVGLYECLASSFRLAYPRSKLTIYLCVASSADPAYGVLRQVIDDFPGVDARIMVEEDDPLLHGAQGHVRNLGPNPKIRNISRAYREAKGDVIWVVDCNIWTAKHAAGRLVDKMYGYLPGGGRTKPYKFVHQLPLVVDLEARDTDERESLLTTSSQSQAKTSELGGRVEEMFMSTTHAKFYSAINTVCIAPCIVGKSNMFRKSHLEQFTDPAQNPILSASDAARGRGVDFFSSYICEDHLIGDLIFRSALPGFLNHGLVFGETAIQPMSGMSLSAYVARRVRWLRVRKWTVLLATLVEPGVESIVCCLHFAFGLTTFQWVHDNLGVPQTWSTMATIWLMMMTAWMTVDRIFSGKLHKLQSIDADEETPFFARGTARQGGVQWRSFREWLPAWLARELLAVPIWATAVLLGTTVDWRGKRFRVSMDMSVAQVGGSTNTPVMTPLGSNTPRSRSKDRLD